MTTDSTDPRPLLCLTCQGDTFRLFEDGNEDDVERMSECTACGARGAI